MRLRTIGALLGALLLGMLVPAAASGSGALTLSILRGTVEINEYGVSVVGVTATNTTGAASGETSVVVDASQAGGDVVVLHMLQSCGRSGQVFTCRTNLGAGDSTQFQLVVQARTGASPGRKGQVRFSAPGSAPVTVDLQVVRPPLADLQTTSDRQVASVGQTVPVTIVVHNAGPDASASPGVDISTADDLELQGFASCPGTVSRGRMCVLPDLAAGQSLAVVVSVKVTGAHPAGVYGMIFSTADPRQPNGGHLDVCVRGGYCTGGRRYGANVAVAGSPKPAASSKPKPQPAASGSAAPAASGAAIDTEPGGHAAAAPDLRPLPALGSSDDLPAMLAFALVLLVVLVTSVVLARGSRSGRDG